MTKKNEWDKKLLNGDEQFRDDGEPLGMTVRDFWSFQFSNILHDPDEIAEFLVAKALGMNEPCNKEYWTLCDIQYRYERQNDLYVFCLLNGTDREEAWPLEVSHWEFYVVPTAVINQECGDQKTVSLSRVRSFASPVTYSELRAAIDKVINEMG